MGVLQDVPISLVTAEGALAAGVCLSTVSTEVAALGQPGVGAGGEQAGVGTGGDRLAMQPVLPSTDVVLAHPVAQPGELETGENSCPDLSGKACLWRAAPLSLGHCPPVMSSASVVQLLDTHLFLCCEYAVFLMSYRERAKTCFI